MAQADTKRRREAAIREDEEEDKEEAAKENIGFEKEEIVESVDEHPNRRVLNLYTVKELVK